MGKRKFTVQGNRNGTLSGVFDQATNARRVARNQAQKPGATRKIEDKRSKPEKHRKAIFAIWESNQY